MARKADPEQLREQLHTEIERTAELIISTGDVIEGRLLTSDQRLLIDIGVTATLSVLRRWDWINPNPGDADESR